MDSNLLGVLAKLASLSDLPVCFTDSHGFLLSYNPGFQRASGLSETQLLKLNVNEILGGLDAEGQALSLSPGFRQGLNLVRPEKETLPIDVEIIAVAPGCYCLALVHRGLFRVPVDRQEQARQSRLVSLGTLAGVIAHDLNNILTSVLGHVSFLKLLLEKSGGHVESMSAIEDGARRAAMMTQQILDYTRGDSEGPQQVDFTSIVGTAVRLIRPTLTDSVSLRFREQDGEQVYVTGREAQLTQVVMNLIVNAREALPNGGTIEVSVGCKELIAGDGIIPEDIQPGIFGSLSIKDNGVGISPEVKERMFEPFFTTKGGTGTGLGLATVFSVVRSHGGFLVVDSVPQNGSSFTVFLPADVEGSSLRSAAKDSESGEQEESIARGHEAILVVDDEEAVRTVVQRSLEHLGYEVDVAENGPQAIELFGKSPQRYKLVILDMIMPRMPGDEVFTRLKEIDRGVSVLIASGYASDERTKAVLDSGGQGFIQKPFSIEELAAEVRTCLDRVKGQATQ